MKSIINKVFIKKIFNKTYIKFSRFITFNKWLTFICIISIFSIFFIELIPKRDGLLNNLCQIYLKLCYSFFSASIFYFIVVHIPRERRKVKSFIFINNKYASIDDELDLLIRAISKNSGISLDLRKPKLEDYKNALIKITPQNIVLPILESNIPVNNWWEYFCYKGEIIRKLIFDLLVLNEIFDLRFFQLLTFIESEISNHLIFTKLIPDNTSLKGWERSICSIIEYNNEILDIITKKMNLYSLEHTKEYRELNRKKMAADPNFKPF